MISMYIKNSMTQDSASAHPGSNATAASTPAPSGRRIQVRKSGVHGKGVFSVAPLKKGEIIIEYKGEIISWKQAQAPPPARPERP